MDFILGRSLGLRHRMPTSLGEGGVTIILTCEKDRRKKRFLKIRWSARLHKKGEPDQGLDRSTGFDKDRRLWIFTGPVLCAGFCSLPGRLSCGPQTDRVIMLFCPDYRDAEYLITALPDGPGDDVQHQVERDVLLNEWVAPGNSSGYLCGTGADERWGSYRMAFCRGRRSASGSLCILWFR